MLKPALRMYAHGLIKNAVSLNFSWTRPPFIQKLNNYEPGRVVYVKGTTPNNGRFFIDFFHMSTPAPSLASIAFRFNPQFDQAVIARNTLTNGVWGVEERSGGMPFAAGEKFNCVFVSQMYGFEVAVNGSHFTPYKYRVPIMEEMLVLVQGLPQIEKIEYI